MIRLIRARIVVGTCVAWLSRAVQFFAKYRGSLHGSGEPCYENQEIRTALESHATGILRCQIQGVPLPIAEFPAVFPFVVFSCIRQRSGDAIADKFVCPRDLSTKSGTMGH